MLYVVYLQGLKLILKIAFICLLAYTAVNLSSCKKDKLITDAGAKVQFSQDSVLFDTVFTSIGSATQNIRIRNKNNQRIKISSIQLQGGSGSQFIINVDGSKGTYFTDLEIAAHDSMYIFIQVNVDPNNKNSPMIVSDQINFVVNGNEQKVILEAWGQDAYYHYPTDAIHFQDGTYFSYSIVDSLPGSFTRSGTTITWKNDKPHVIYSYCVVDSLQKLVIPAGTEVFLNYKAGLWVFRGGQLKVQGLKDKEVIFRGARREKDFADEPGQWDRIWINEGSEDNIINYAIIKNGFIGVQAELVGNDFIGAKRRLTITNTKIQNMSKWGLYGVAYNIIGGNNVISNCQESSVNLVLGGNYKFYHCTFSNFWSKDKTREKQTVTLNNYNDDIILPDTAYFGNCIIDGKLPNELSLDVKAGVTSGLTIDPIYQFNNCWIKTNSNVSDVSHYFEIRKGSTSLNYKDAVNYNFETSNEDRIKNFTNTQASIDAARYPKDLNNVSRNQVNVTIGAYEN